LLFTSHLIRQIPLGKRTMLLLLTLAAGSMDSISYLGLGRVFPAMMTGNVVFLGLTAGQGEYLAASRGFVALIGFSIGVITGAAVVEKKPREEKWPLSVTWALILELWLLVLFVCIWLASGGQQTGVFKYVLILISAMAMGVQSAAVGYLGVPGITTTYITGTLTALMVAVRHRLRWRRASQRSEAEKSRSAVISIPTTSHMVSLAAVIFFYGVGAFIGSALHGNDLLIVQSGFPTLVVAVVVINATVLKCLKEDGQNPSLKH